jgi:hypothetical protein
MHPELILGEAATAALRLAAICGRVTVHLVPDCCSPLAIVLAIRTSPSFRPNQPSRLRIGHRWFRAA